MKISLFRSHFKLALTHCKTHSRMITEERKISGHCPIICYDHFLPSAQFLTLIKVWLILYWKQRESSRNPPLCFHFSYIIYNKRSISSLCWHGKNVKGITRRVIKHSGLGYCSIKSLLMTTRWGEKLIVPKSLENV